MAYPETVERWRATVAKYVPAHLVDKALYVMNLESGGNPAALGDGGHSVGLYQIQADTNIAGRPSKGALLDPEFNIRYAAESLGMANGNFAAWGEGTENLPPYDPATGRGRFGALGNHPYPGDVAVNGRAPIPGDITVNLPLPDFLPDVPGIDIPGLGRAAATLLPGGGIAYVLGDQIFDKFGNPLGTLSKGLDAIKGAASATLEILRWLLTPSNWFRMFFAGLGITMFFFGGYIYLRGDEAISTATKAATMGAA